MSNFANYDKLYKTEYNKLAIERADLEKKYADLTNEHADLANRYETLVIEL